MQINSIGDVLQNRDVLTPILIFLGIVLVVLIRSAAGVISSIARERTRREIAAFIAEGAMSPEQGEKLMKAGEKHT
ncbi:MAG: hypothetical protein HBSAPP03_19690 [Phycisphaerae bacterium]|nr:MAG: hypothetical protein HBSAPP03_19690 [Phycisphaerae bacterium]